MNKTFLKIVYELTKNLYSPLWLAATIEIINCLQIVHITVKSNFFSFNNQQLSFFNIIYTISSFATGKSTTDMAFAAPQIQLLGALLTSYFALIFVIILITVIRIIKQVKRNEYLEKSIAMFLLVHSRILFFPLQYVLCDIFYLWTKNELNLSSNYSDKVMLLGEVIFCSIVNVTLAVTKELLLFEIGKTKDAFSAQNNFLAQITLIHKMIGLLLFFVKTENNMMPIIRSFVFAFLTSWTSYFLYKRLPFYNLKFLKTVIVTTGINFNLSILSILKAFDDVGWISETILLALSPLTMKIYLCLFDRLSDKIKKGKAHDNPQRVMHFIVAMKEIFFAQSQNQSSVSRYIKRKSILSCGKTVEKIMTIGRESEKDFKRELYDYISLNLEKGLLSYPKSEVLLLYLADVYLRKFKNFLKFETLLTATMKLNPSFSTSVSLQRLKDQSVDICIKGEKNENDYLNVNDYFRHQENNEIMKKTMIFEADRHLRFWHLFKQSNILVVELLNISSEIEALSQRICKRYDDEINKSDTKFTGFLLTYTIYLHIIKELPHEAAKVMKKVKSLIQTPTFSHSLDIYSGEKAIFVLSLDKQKIGRILDASPSIESIFKLARSQVIGESLDCIVPFFVASKFKPLILNYIQGIGLDLESGFYTYAKTDDGMFFEAKIQFQLFPYKNNGLSLLMLLTKTSSQQTIIFCDSKGIVLECSRNMYNMLNTRNFNLRSIKAEAIFPELREVLEGSPDNKVVHITKMNTNNLNTYEQRECNTRMKSSLTAGFNANNSSESLVTLQNDVGIFSSRLKNIRKNNETNSKRNNTFGLREAINWKEPDTEEAAKILTSRLNNEKDDELYALSQTSNEGIRPRCYSPKKIFYVKEISISFDVEIKQFCLDSNVYKALILSRRGNKNTSGKKSVGFTKQNLNNQSLKQDAICDNLILTDENIHNYQNKGKEQTENLNSSCKNESVSLKNIDNTGKEMKIPKIMTLKVIEQTEGHSLNGIYLDRMIRAIKTLKQTFSRKRLHPLSKTSIFGVYFIMFSVMVLGVGTFFTTQDSISQIEEGLKIVVNANERLNLSIDIWSKFLIIYSRSTGARADMVVARLFQVRNYNNTLRLISKNNELRTRISNIKDKDFIEQVYTRDVTLWRALENDTYQKIEADTFSTTDLLINKYLAFTNFPNLPLLVNNSEFLFALNNTANEYWISSERLILKTQELLDSIISDNINLLQNLFKIINIALFLFFCSVSAFVWIIIKGYQRLFIAIIRVNESHIYHRIFQIENTKNLLSEDTDTKEFVQKGLDFLNNPTTQKQTEPRNNMSQYRKGDDKSFMRNMVVHLMKYLGLSLFCIGLISGMFLKSITESIAEFKSFETIKHQLFLTTQSVCRVNLSFGIYYFMMLFQNNQNILTYNKLPRVHVNEVVNELSLINENLLSAFSDDINANEEAIMNFLNKDLCGFISEGQDQCVKSMDQGKGLLSLNQRYYRSVALFLELYQKKSSDTKSLLNSFAIAISNDSPTLVSFLNFLSYYIVSHFEVHVDQYSTQTLAQTLIILGIIILSIIVIQFISIKRLKSFDVGRRKILNVLPYAFFQNSRILKFYLIKEFNQEVVEIKDLIS